VADDLDSLVNRFLLFILTTLDDLARVESLPSFFSILGRVILFSVTKFCMLSKFRPIKQSSIELHPQKLSSNNYKPNL
jgi:hypothetical protein